MYHEGLEEEKERSSAAEELASLILQVYKKGGKKEG